MTNISVTQIDYQNNIPATDSEWRNMNPPQDHPALERSTPPSGNGWNVNYIVYKKGQTISGITTYTNEQPRAVNWSLTVNSGKLISEADNFSQEWGIFFEETPLTYTITSATSGTVDPYGSFDVHWTVTNAPNFLCAGWMALPVTLNLTYVDDFAQQYVNLGILAAVNLSIMVDQPVDTMSIPWADLTYEVGLWGWGATSTSEAQEDLVNGIHYSNRHLMRGRLMYDFESMVYTTPRIVGTTFDVTSLVRNLHNYPEIVGDCNDFAQLLCLAFEANGINAAVKLLQYSFRNGVTDFGFYTNLMCRAGFDDSTVISTYKENSFNLHMVVAPDGLAGDACSDASSSYRHNLSGGSHLNPVNRWPLPNYWSLQISGITVGLANRPRDSAIPLGTPYDSSWAGINFRATQLI